MRWILIIAVLATVTVALSNPTSRRNWPHIKQVLTTGLFDRNKTVIVKQPEIPEDKTYQLFKINGYEDVVINLTRRGNTKKIHNEKVPLKADLMSPEIEIITKYLGAANRDEAIVAIEALQSILKSGLLGERNGEDVENDENKRYHEDEDFVNENTPKLKPVDVYVEDLPSIDIRFGQTEENVNSNRKTTKNQNINDVNQHIPHEYIFVPPNNEILSPNAAKPNNRKKVRNNGPKSQRKKIKQVKVGETE